jgi:RNA polymerase sigma factor (sigma-70 family)
MADSGLKKVVEHLRSIAFRQHAMGLSDRQLLEIYLAQRDDAAYSVLLRRHSALVWAVCRRILGSHHDAEEAFQATFLVLVRRAASIASRDQLANWLYGVAHRTALKARAARGRRQARERQVADMPEPQGEQEGLWSKLLPVLDQELSRLPDKYRTAIVLCDLEGKTRKEAAKALRLPEGTVASRLTRGRAMLAARLRRHGLAVSGGTVAAAIAANAEAVCVPVSVVWGTIKAATLLAAGQTAATGAMSAQVAALTEGVVRAMFLSKLKIIGAAVLLAGTVVALGGGLATYQLTAGQGSADARPVSKQTTSPAQLPKTIVIDNKKLAADQNAKAVKDDEKQIEQQPLLNLLDLQIDMKNLIAGSPMALREALSYIVEAVKIDVGKELPILIDTEQFKAENPDAFTDANVLYDTKVAFPPFPTRMKVGTALKFIISKIETKNATYAVLPDRILVTTYLKNSPVNKLSEKVRGVFEKRPLAYVLRQLSEMVGTTIVIDNRAGEKAKTEVSATFLDDTDLAGALRVLTEMADLKVLMLDGTIYVTTPAHADVLRKEKRLQLEAKRDMAQKADPLWPYDAEPRGRFAEEADLPAVVAPKTPERKLQEKISGRFEKRPLNSILEELAQRYGTTIIFDSRIAEKAKTEVSATFRDDVTLWGALRILTEMADLRAVNVGGAVFVTTPGHAEAFKKDS